MTKNKKILWTVIAIASPFVLFQLAMGLFFFLYSLEFFATALDKGYMYAVCETCTTKDAVIWSLWFYPVLFIFSILPYILTFMGIRWIYRKLIKGHD